MVCYHCFQDKGEAVVCPHCGYDPTGSERKHPLALKPGSILNGRYIVGRVLGQGGFGITYIAQDYQTKQRVAIKEYLPTEFAGRSSGSSLQVYFEARVDDFRYGMTQFLEEARTLAAVTGSENIVRIHSYFEENDTAYFTMDYAQGLPLDDYLRQRGRALRADEAARLFLPLMQALGEVHGKGIVHRDIAPDNIIVSPEGVAQLIDFGAARYSTGEKSKSLDVILKHGFAPMEQYTRHGRQGPWTDVYAMAATYYYALTGTVPPDAIERVTDDTLRPPDEQLTGLSPAEAQALMKGLAVQAQERWQSMGQFIAAMQEGRVPESAHGKEPGASAAKPKPGRLPLILAAVLAAALVVFGAVRMSGRGSAAGTDTTPAASSVTAEAEAAAGDLEVKYKQAVSLISKKNYKTGVPLLRELQTADYKDSADLLRDSMIQWAYAYLEDGKYTQAIALLSELNTRGIPAEDAAAEDIYGKAYQAAVEQYHRQDFSCSTVFARLGDYKDSAKYLLLCRPRSSNIEQLVEIIGFEDAGSRIFNDIPTAMSFLGEDTWIGQLGFIQFMSSDSADSWTATWDFEDVDPGSWSFSRGIFYVGRNKLHFEALSRDEIQITFASGQSDILERHVA